MAELAGVACLSHTPYLYTEPEDWVFANDRRREAAGAPGPGISLAQARAEHARCQAALARLRRCVVDARPDAVLVIGDDQREQYQISGIPQFAMYLGAQFSGYRRTRFGTIPYPGSPREPLPKRPADWATVAGEPALGRHLTRNLVAAGFDVAFSLELADPGAGMGHAVMRPLYHLTPRYDLPVLALSVNCYFAPQPSAARCAALGSAIAGLIGRFPTRQRILVVGSGGLWHTPNAPGAALNEEFDHTILASLRAGDPTSAAAYFDAYPDPGVDRTTGMTGGLGSGTGETRNWIAAVATIAGTPASFVEYVPIAASPIGAAFAFWTPTASTGTHREEDDVRQP